MEFVFRVGFVEFAQELELLETALECDVIVANDFDGDLDVWLLRAEIACSYHIGENALASATEHGIATVECFADVDPLKNN